jgi:hypothetical protein
MEEADSSKTFTGHIAYQSILHITSKKNIFAFTTLIIGKQ